MKNFFPYILIMCAFYALPIHSQERADSVFASEQEKMNAQLERDDAAIIAEIDSIMQQMEREQAVRDVIEQFERAKLKQEQSFDFDCFMPFCRGAILTFTEDKFMSHAGTLSQKNEIFDKTDYLVAGAPLAAAWALKSAGVKSRSTIQRMLTANALSMAFTFGATKALKTMVDETRPDGSDNKSLPSGHTSFAFASATILAREYGYLSPWIPIGGYATATATQYLRIQHNKHWMNDLYVGAGIGMLSTNLGYYLTDLMLKGNGILTPPEIRLRDLQRVVQFNNQPSGFSFASGTEVGSRTFRIDDVPIKAYASFTSGVEASWFMNQNFAVELMTRFTTGYAKVYNDRFDPFAPYTYSGENMSIYHMSLAGKYSVPYALGKRISVRGFAGMRHISSLRFDAVETLLPSYVSTVTQPYSNLSAESFSLTLPAENAFELGCGFGYDAIDKKNYSVGFACDYYHAFSSVFRSRYNISSVWKILF